MFGKPLINKRPGRRRMMQQKANAGGSCVIALAAFLSLLFTLGLMGVCGFILSRRVKSEVQENRDDFLALKLRRSLHGYGCYFFAPWWEL